MSEIVKGVLGGSWSLVVGWILPSALNLVLFVAAVLPLLDGAPVRWRWEAALTDGIALLAVAVVVGLLLAAVQTPLYRLLEGYLGWRPSDPAGRWRWLRSPVSTVLARSRERHLRRKQILRGRLDLLELSPRAAREPLRPELAARLEQARQDRRLDRYAASDARRTITQRGLLREQVRRYPVGDDQVAPTRLGNAIRRLEDYGYDRYRLDSQILWYELYAVAPEQARRQVDEARTTVDFLVCLLCGNLLTALVAAAAAVTGTGARVPLAAIAVALVGLAYGWYRIAVVSTDDWAAAVRALVNIGRKPLAETLGLQLPDHLDGERAMWTTVSRTSARPHDSLADRGDRYRVPAPPPPITPAQPPAPVTPAQPPAPVTPAQPPAPTRPAGGGPGCG